MTSESDSEWFLKDKAGITGPLSESDMRKQVDLSSDDDLLIRQGSSDWRSVEVIRKKIRQLEANGIFVRYKNVAEGPFTLTRAHHVLKRMTPGGIDVRTGAKGAWVAAEKWLSKIDKLLEVESKEMDSLSIAVQHVLGRKGFSGSTQNSGELDIAPADKEVEPAPTKTQETTEQPRWLTSQPAAKAEPVADGQATFKTRPSVHTQPVLEAEVVRTAPPHKPKHGQRGKSNRHTEPVIEVVKVLHTAEIADRTNRAIAGAEKTTNRTTPPALPRSQNDDRTGTPAVAPTTPTASANGPAIRTRPRNHTSLKNRTRTSQEKLIIGGLAASIACVVAFAGWKWLASSGTTVAQGTTPSEVLTNPDALFAGGTGTSEPAMQPDESSEPTDKPNSNTSDPPGDAPDQASAEPTGDALSEPVKQEQSQGVTTGTTTTTPQGDAKLAPLVISTGTLFHPRFGTIQGEVNAGTAFAAKLAGRSQILVVSALHLFGPAGGLKTDIEPDKIATSWNKLVVEDCKSQNYFGEIQMQPITLPGARPHPQKSDIGDVAACKVTDATAIEALSLSQRIPSNGERVWLVSKLPGSRELMHPATVERMKDGWLQYSFSNPSITLKSTSGAPIVDQKGKVIAVHAGGTKKSGKTIGFGTPVANFYPTLATLVH